MLGPTTASREFGAAMQKVADLGDAKRFWRINQADLVWEGLQYAGRPSFWDSKTPLRERAPLVQSFLPRAAGRRLVALVFGEDHFPDVTVKPRAYGVALDPTALASLSQLVDELIAVVTAPLLMQHYLTNGLKSGAVAAVSSLRDGLPCVEIHPAKHCHPEGIKPDGSVKALRIQYKTEVDDPATGRPELHWYRRVLDDQGDRVWPTIKCEHGKEPDWDAIPPAEITPLEFVPVRWTRNLYDPAACDVDGQPLFAGLEDEVEALDLALSQLYRYAQYNGDPILARIGATDDDGALGPAGRTSASTESRFSWFNSAWKVFGGGGEPATKKGPGNLWTLPKDADLKMVESSGSGATIFAEAVRQLRRHILDAVGVVMADADSLGGGDLSARALALLHAPTLALAGQLRVEYGTALKGILDDLLRLCTTQAAQTDGVLLASHQDASRALATFYRPTQSGGRRWLGVPLELNWGPFFTPGYEEIGAAVTAAQAANGGKPVLSLKSSVEYLAPLLGIADSDAEVQAIQIEEAMGQDAAQSMLGAVGQPQAPAPPPAQPLEAGGEPAGPDVPDDDADPLMRRA